MFPKTTYPNEMRALLLVRFGGERAPPVASRPYDSCAGCIAWLGPSGTISRCPNLRRNNCGGLPRPRRRGPSTGCVRCWSVCCPERNCRKGQARQTAAPPSRALAAEACPAGEEALFRLLDRGLRLEPTRRFLNRGALLSALGEAEEEVNARVRPGLCLWGTAGVFIGKMLPLSPPVTLGRQPDVCQLIFPPDTRGVSRHHCRVELVWGTVLITDLHSRYGTAAGGAILSPGPIPRPFCRGRPWSWLKARQALCAGS